MKHFVFLFLVLCALSCLSKKKLQQAAIEQYPVRDSMVIHRDTIVDTLDIPPLEVTVHDTVDCPPSDTSRRVFREKKTTIPGRKFPIKIPVADTTNWLRYTAIEAALKEELQQCNKNGAEWKGKAEAYQVQAKQSGKWFWWFLILAMAVGATVLFRVLGAVKF